MQRIDVHNLADETKLNSFQWFARIESNPIRCFSILVLDSFDVPVAAAPWRVMS
ncbi:hypothetical protein [Cupriavidus necator]